ncbi:HEPN domain-containing protein [Macromonas nakdongensis]|uniref:HEPN domain-containing protein n=1 Tax=Macromonas nakdongensis TaxID=1843082 RepID=UPI0018E36B6D|nr:HEPN domain-containing protein [Macromonas nakdongensis]
MNMTTSQAEQTFAEAIKDAENLLAHFKTLNTLPPPPETEVLKRAGLVMAMTAWETYVEDRVQEAALHRLSGLTDTSLGSFVKSRLEEEIKRLHNPTAEKTLQLFQDYAGVDLLPHWKWNHVDAPTAKQKLNGYLNLRGDVVHRSRVSVKGPPQPHPVTKEDLQKAINFLKELVRATEKAFG